MLEDVKNKWVAALRSGEYEQCTKFLFDGKSSYCCLGVLCKVLGGSFTPVKHPGLQPGDPSRIKWQVVLPDGTVTMKANILPEQITVMAGMRKGNDCGTYLIDRKANRHSSLTDDNDQRRLNFDRIADIIEEEWVNL